MEFALFEIAALVMKLKSRIPLELSHVFLPMLTCLKFNRQFLRLIQILLYLLRHLPLILFLLLHPPLLTILRIQIPHQLLIQLPSMLLLHTIAIYLLLAHHLLEEVIFPFFFHYGIVGIS